MSTKQAFGGQFASDFGGALRTGLAGAAASAAITGAAMAANKVWDAVTKKQDYNAMLRANPDLMSHHEARPTDMANAFTSLRTMNPTFSKDPLVAGSYMRRAMDAGANAGGVMREALEARDKMPAYLMESVMRGGAEGAKAHLDAESKNRAGMPYQQSQDTLRNNFAREQFTHQQQQDKLRNLSQERDARFGAHTAIERSGGNQALIDSARRLGLIQ